jgi:hypothetical protein
MDGNNRPQLLHWPDLDKTLLLQPAPLEILASSHATYFAAKKQEETCALIYLFFCVAKVIHFEIYRL